MNICFATSECVPFVKTGGLADVSGALPKALAKLGCKVKVFLPLYSSLPTIDHDLIYASDIENISVQVGIHQYTFNTWYGKDGPQNYSQWEDGPFNELLGKIDSEVDAAKRQALIREAELIMEENPPLLPISWEKINDGWFDYVKGHHPYNYFGIYDVVRMDTFWLDK